MIAQIDAKYIRYRPWKLWSRLISYSMFEGRPLTTRGQWINPFLFFSFNIQKKLPALKHVRFPIFILGTGRSGTTILGIVLSMHRHVGFLNEPKALWHALHPNEDLIGSYSRGIARYRMDANDATSEVCESAQSIYGSYLFTSFSSRLVDKYPELIFRYDFVKKIFPDARFVFLSRNGWDTCSSIEHWSRRLGKVVGNESHDWWGVNRRKWNLLISEIIPEHSDLAPYREKISELNDHRIMAAVEWIVTMREGLKLSSNHPQDVLHLPYEELCSNPRNTLQHAAEFLKLEKDDIFFRYAEEVLKPPGSYNEFPLPEYLIKPFNEVQLALGANVKY